MFLVLKYMQKFCNYNGYALNQYYLKKSLSIYFKKSVFLLFSARFLYAIHQPFMLLFSDWKSKGDRIYRKVLASILKDSVLLLEKPIDEI